MKLTKDDLFEIEKILDIQSSHIIITLNKLANTCINAETVGKGNFVLVGIFKEYQKSYDKLKTIRDKLEKMRVGK